MVVQIRLEWYNINQASLDLILN